MHNVMLKTSDNVDIAVNYYANGFNEVVIVAPGWCMTKDSNAFARISEFFAKKYDVLTLDFRGHGKSKGFFTFTAKEEADMQAVIDFAVENRYEKIYLAGFSLGAAMVLICAAKNSKIDKVIAVSPPYEFGKIENQMWKKEAWLETFKKLEIKRFLSIRPYLIPLKKERPADYVDKIKVPTLFIAGEKDPTVHSWHTEKLYQLATCPKKYKLYKNGYHAEDLYLHFEQDFSELCFDWLEEKQSLSI